MLANLPYQSKSIHNSDVLLRNIFFYIKLKYEVYFSDSSDQKVITFHETTEVVMCAMTSEIITAYIKTGEPL